MNSDSENSVHDDVVQDEVKIEETNEEFAVKSDPDDDDGGTQSPPPKRKKQKTQISTETEENLMDLVFGNKAKLIKNLEKCVEQQRSSGDGQKREPVWHDSGDELDVDDVIDYNQKGAPLIRKDGKYKHYLEKNFKNIIGTPAWANLDRDTESDSDDEILQTVGHVVKGKSGDRLQKTQLDYKRLKDLNRATYAEGPGINSVEFHPTSSVAVVSGRAGIATIYSIDGIKNDKLHSIGFKNYPIKCCRLNCNGMEAIVGSSRKFFYTYDLMTGDTERIFLPKTITKMTDFEISPCGKLMAIIGRFGEIHLMDTSSKELIHTLKQQYESTAVAFSTDSLKLFSHSTDAEVNIFDVRMQRVQHRFIDEGCVNGSAVTTSPNGQFIACGSQQGVVTVYDIEKTLQSNIPAPIKTIFNLATSITAIKFNHTSEILGVCSKEVNNAIKLIHFPSGTVFSNFPDFQAKIGKPTVVNFSPQSGYMAVGTAGKEVALFRLKHFGNY